MTMQFLEIRPHEPPKLCTIVTSYLNRRTTSLVDLCVKVDDPYAILGHDAQDENAISVQTRFFSNDHIKLLDWIWLLSISGNGF